MKICITSTGSDLNALVDPKFGRCVNFIFVDPKTMEYEVVSNSSAASSGGAGIKAGQLVSEHSTEAVLTGNVGPNAYKTLTSADIKIYVGVKGAVKDAIIAFNSGTLAAIDNPSVESHSGM